MCCEAAHTRRGTAAGGWLVVWVGTSVSECVSSRLLSSFSGIVRPPPIILNPLPLFFSNNEIFNFPFLFYFVHSLNFTIIIKLILTLLYPVYSLSKHKDSPI